VKHVCTQTAQDLLKNGPLVEVNLLAHPTVRATRPKTTSLAAIFLLDTGAQHTFVEHRLAESLGLEPLRYVPVVGVSQQSDLCPVYLMTIRMAVQDHQGRDVESVDFNGTVIGLESSKGQVAHQGLLGRDFLRDLRVIYDGRRGIVELHKSKEQPDRTPS
jgi:predicted aspartyl protease